jgi:hypothetical protein
VIDSVSLELLAAFAGGLLGAAVGALPAFIFTGFAVLAGVAVLGAGGGAEIVSSVAFGPVFGPHISFGGGVAAAAYAHRQGYVDSGRDITAALMGLNRPDVLLVGGLFGTLGWLLNWGFQALGWVSWTDTIALTVVVSAVVARLALGRKGLTGQVAPGGARWRPSETANWLRWQETPPQLALIGFAVATLSAYMAAILGPNKGGDVLGFGFAAALLLFLQFGARMPVTHHIALPAAAAAISFDSFAAGIAFGIAGAFAGELWARLLLIHGDTHIDPPAAAIATMIFLLRAIEMVV